MRVQGLVFVGTRTSADMTAFARDVLGLQATQVEGASATFFPLPDGSTFAVHSGADEDERTVGFLVDDVVAAAAELARAGVETDEVQENAQYRYVHFRAPDAQLYELVQRLPVHAGQETGQHDGTA